MEANNLIEISTARTAPDADGTIMLNVTVRRDDASDGYGHARSFTLAEGDRVWVRWQEVDAATSTSVVLAARRDDDAPTGLALGILTDGPTEAEHHKRGVVYHTTANTVRVGILPRAPRGHIDRAGAVSLGRPAIDNVLTVAARVRIGVV